MTRLGSGKVALLAALLLSVSKGTYGLNGLGNISKDLEPWRRKKRQKGPSCGPGGPTVRLKIPKRRSRP